MSNHNAHSPLPFGAYLKRLRRAANLSQKSLAARTSYSVSYISKLERGARMPIVETIVQLASALELTADERTLLYKAAGQLAHGAGDLTATPGAPTDPQAPSAVAVSWAAPRATSAHSTVFVGRRHELLAIEALLAGEGRAALMLAGEPGMGKSRLLRLGAERGVATGWKVLMGCCLRHDWKEPFAPLVGMLEQLIRQTPPEARPTLLADCEELARVLPDLTSIFAASAQATSTPASAVPAAPWRIRDAMARLLQNAAGPAGTLLVMDDLHWAGLDTFYLLSGVLSLPVGPPVRLLGAYRQTERPGESDFTTFITDLASAELTDLLSLRPLDARESGLLLKAVLPPSLAGEATARMERTVLMRRAGGVPFYLISCAQAMRRAEDAGRQDDQGGGDIPWEVAQTVRQRLGALPDVAQIVVCVTALSHQPVAGELLLYLGPLLGPLLGMREQSQAELLRGIEAACRAGLLAEYGGRYSLPYPVLAEVIVSDLGPAQRKRLHSAIAEALVAVEPVAPLRMLADQFVQAGDPGMSEEYLRRSAQEATASADHHEAAKRYGDLAQRLDRQGRMLDAAEARFEQSHALYHLNEYRQTLRVLEDVAGVYARAEKPELWAQATAAMGWTYASMGDPAPGIERIERVLRSERDYITRTRAGLYMSLANLYFVAGRYGLQLGAATRAVELAQIAGDSMLIAKALACRAQARHMLNYTSVAAKDEPAEGELADDESADEDLTEDGLRTLEVEVIELAQSVGDHWTLAYAADSAAYMYMLRGKFEHSRALAGRALATARQTRDPSLLAFMLLRRGSLAYYRGTWHRAHHDIHQGLNLLRHIESVHTPYGQIVLGRLLLAEGHWEQAHEHIMDGLEPAESRGDPQLLRLAHGALAERELLLGDPAAALHRLDRVRDRNKQQEESDVTELLPLICWAYLRLGDVEQARRLLQDAIRRAWYAHMRCAMVDALRVRALLLTNEAQWSEAAATLEDGLALTRDMRYPYGEARLLYTYGLLLGAQGSAPCASQQFEAALAILNRLGERLYAERVELELANARPPH